MTTSAQITARIILKQIGCKSLSLHRGPGGGYFYFTYDDGRRYETESVYVCAYAHLSLDAWVEAGRDFVRRMERAAA